MNEILDTAIEIVAKSKVAYCKFITANDAGSTGAHQSGYHLHKSSWPLYFNTPGVKQSNKDKYVKIRWQHDFITESRFIYYGVGSRDEYRLTRFGKNFPFLTADNVGDLLVICKLEEDFYEAFVFSTDDDIQNFFSRVGIDITEVNSIIKSESSHQKTLEQFYKSFISRLTTEFPPAIEISNEAKRIFNEFYNVANKDVIKEADKVILGWLDIEYQLFKAIEVNRYSNKLTTGFKDVDTLVEFSNTILNRRKSRAGKSLENHLSSIFTLNDLKYETQVVTEGNKRPDFIFPGSKEYHDAHFAFRGLTFLGAKTTCKDRWRQIINEAARIPNKHLFTLQQGISANQLDEMREEKITLVVPKAYHKSYPESHRHELMSLENFISYVTEKQS